ncbi:hypothetical protein BcDW1_10804 [Botrytis cinerea BcDW1]|uniref:Uncharacterized protein n=1 Tax=Botryotinia fuckeliana (strain BcDW1) TaxID=1290391 RepID=M7TGU8_BOTF1|nr:hypothetical protein BcDW1_10804 [Botrytis cinerea BcDW1]
MDPTAVPQEHEGREKIEVGVSLKNQSAVPQINRNNTFPVSTSIEVNSNTAQDRKQAGSTVNSINHRNGVSHERHVEYDDTQREIFNYKTNYRKVSSCSRFFATIPYKIPKKRSYTHYEN